MTAPLLTLKEAQKTAQTKVSRVSDFLTTEEKEERIQTKLAAKPHKKAYTAVDAYVAEIIARFGYDAYKAWLEGEIEEDKMSRLVLAERAREKRLLTPLESIIIGAVAGANQPTKNRSTPKGLKMAIKVLKEETEKANG